MSSILNRFRGSSPHTRGALDQMIVAELEPRIIPAYAGSTGSSSPSIRFVFSLDPLRLLPRSAFRRIIPAYAGSTTISTCGAGTRADHPRIRGEHYLAGRLRFGAAGSSPHTRGAPLLFLSGVVAGRIIPAYAGSTGRRRRVPPCLRDHPRIRGEHF